MWFLSGKFIDDVISKCQKFRFTCKSLECCSFIHLGKIISLKGYKKPEQYIGESVSNCVNLTLTARESGKNILVPLGTLAINESILERSSWTTILNNNQEWRRQLLVGYLKTQKIRLD